MTRIVLRFLNFPGLIFLTLIAIGIQTSLFAFWPLHYIQPDVVLLVVIWASLKRGLWEGGWITLFAADFAELHSAAPQGMFLLTYMAVFLGVRGLSRMIVIPNIHALVLVTMFISIFWKLASLGVLHLLGASGNQWRHTLLFLFPGAIVESFAGIWVYRGLEKYDWLTFKRPHNEYSAQDTEEELYLYEGEGI
ncbi:hypothetical protein WDW37_08565 [Bdellovibrionota bacterium FG-1]